MYKRGRLVRIKGTSRTRFKSLFNRVSLSALSAVQWLRLTWFSLGARTSRPHQGYVSYPLKMLGLPYIFTGACAVQ